MNKLKNDQIKCIIITGGLGFIGSAVINSLLNNTNLKVINIDKESYASDHQRIKSILSKIKDAKNRYIFHKVNLINHELTKQIISNYNPDFIIHLAAESHVDRSISGPREFIESNILGTYNLLDSTLHYWEKLKGNKKNNFRLLHVSTDEVYGSLGQNGQFDEKSNYSPNSPYSASKASSDHLVQAWYHTYGLPTLITNCGNNYGPWQFPEKLIPLVILKALQSKKIPIYGDGLNIRDWLFIEDHVEALLLVAEKGVVGESYCIGGNGERSNKEVVLKICEIMDKKFPSKAPHKDLIEFVKDRPGHDKRYSINPSKIIKNLGWEANHTFEEGLEVTINWYLDNIDWYEEISSNEKYDFGRLGKVNE